MLAEIEMKKQILAEERKIEDDKAKNVESHKVTSKKILGGLGLFYSLGTAGLTYEAIALGIAAAGGPAMFYAALTFATSYAYLAF
jgi:hypothetical protein